MNYICREGAHSIHYLQILSDCRRRQQYTAHEMRRVPSTTLPQRCHVHSPQGHDLRVSVSVGVLRRHLRTASGRLLRRSVSELRRLQTQQFLRPVHVCGTAGLIYLGTIRVYIYLGTISVYIYLGTIRVYIYLGTIYI